MTDADGTVVGVVATIDGAERRVQARSGVVVAAGGFVYNHAMLEAHCPVIMRADEAWKVGQPNDDGRGIRIAQGAGAAVTRMDSFECALPIGPPHRMARAILVNRDGRRFVNEDTYTGRIGQQALLDQDGEIYMVVSEELFEVNFVGMRIQWAAETPEELARDIGIPEATLATTVAAYNEGAAQGVDPEWHKAPDFLVPLRPPYGAVDLRVGVAGDLRDVHPRRARHRCRRPRARRAGRTDPRAPRGRAHDGRHRGPRLRQRHLARRRHLLRPPRRRSC